MTMTMINPIPIGESELTDSDAAYLLSEWDNSTSYAIGDEVYLGMRKYEALIASTNQDPSTNPLDGSDNPYWLDTGPSNPWAMFDTQNFTQTTATSTLTVVISAGRNNSLSLFNVTGVTSVTVTATSVLGGTSVTAPYQMSEMGGVGMWSWLFDERITKSNLFAEGWFEYSDTVLTIEFTGTDIGVGNCVVGKTFDIGPVADGMTITPKDASTMKIEFEETIYTEGPSYYEVAGTVKVDKARADIVLQRVFNAKGPRVFICSTDYTSSFIYGVANTFSLQTSISDFQKTTFKLTGST